MPPLYDAVLLLSFGGPEGMDDVGPFLENVLRGRNVPPERLREVTAVYARVGGVSPINGQNRTLLAALRAELATHGPALPVYWGNRNWHPFLADTLGAMARDGVKRALAFATSAYASYSGCRQYLEDIARARAAVGDSAPEVRKLRLYYNHPRFIEANVARVSDAFARVSSAARDEAALVFTAHSIPLVMAGGSDYEAQLRETARLVAEGAGRGGWSLAFQSRSGPPQQPWLQPDIGEHLAALAADGARDVVVAPIGFVSDHMEVVYDLDVQARQRAEAVGVSMVRASTAGAHPAFVGMIRELVAEEVSGDPERRTVGSRGPSPDVCREGCCPPPAARPPS